MAKKVKESVLQGNNKYCYVSFKRQGLYAGCGLEKHHIYAGKNRKISDDNGFWVWLLPAYHTQSNIAVHCRDGAELDLELKRDCQRAYEKNHTREEFRALIGKSYL